VSKGVVIGCKKTRQTAVLLSHIGDFTYAESYLPNLDGVDWIFRYGNSAELGMRDPMIGTLDNVANDNGVMVINKAKYIASACDKFKARQAFASNEVKIPASFSPDSWPRVLVTHFPYVARPIFHMKGRGFNIVNTPEEVDQYWKEGFYFQELVLKKEEYRVFCMFGRVLEVNIKEKTRPDADEIVRNHRRGWRFKWIPYEESNRAVTSMAIKAVQALRLDFGAVDLCINESGEPVVFEVNTAPGMVERKCAKVAEKLKERFRG